MFFIIKDFVGKPLIVYSRLRKVAYYVDLQSILTVKFEEFKKISQGFFDG